MRRRFKRTLSGDEDMDKHYLQGDHNYEGIFVACLVAVLFVVAIWPKQG